MALISVPVMISCSLVAIILLNKMIAIFMVQNFLGLPDYVLGELLSSSATTGSLNGPQRLHSISKEHPPDGSYQRPSSGYSDSSSHDEYDYQKLEINEKMLHDLDDHNRHPNHPDAKSSPSSLNSQPSGDEWEKSEDDEESQERIGLIRFTPSRLDFKQHPIGIPVVRKVTIENLRAENKSIQLTSISGNSVNFHCSFFDEKFLPYFNSNAAFDVVFLPRTIGLIENQLFIHTSVGSFKYTIRAVGTQSEYRLRPVIGAKVPVNSSYAQLIHIYNPHSYSLQLTEVYSSGGGLHLELPSLNEQQSVTTNDPYGHQPHVVTTQPSVTESTKSLWQIPPFESKAIMRANFLATTEKNHTAYIRIKTNATSPDDTDLNSNGLSFILPIEVEVSSAPGIYSPIDLLDFGVSRTIDGPKEMILRIINAGSKNVTIQNIISNPSNDALEIQMTGPHVVGTPPDRVLSSGPSTTDYSNQHQSIRIPPNVYHSVEIAKLVMHPSKITDCSKQCSGRIVVKSKNNQHKLIIPYQITLLQGYIGFKDEDTLFQVSTDGSDEEKRPLVLSNHFQFPILIHSLSFGTTQDPMGQSAKISDYFELSFGASSPDVKSTSGGLIIMNPDEAKTVGWIKFKPTKDLIHVSSFIRINTNVSYFDVPLAAFSGKLDVQIMDGGYNYLKRTGDTKRKIKSDTIKRNDLNFGSIGLNEKRKMSFKLINHNPKDVLIKSIKTLVTEVNSVMNGYDLELMGIHPKNQSVTSDTSDPNLDTSREILLKSGHVALFNLNIEPIFEEGSFAGSIRIMTNYQEVIEMKFWGKSIKGSLSPLAESSPVFISNSFPGRISSQSIQIMSTFTSEIYVKNYLISPVDENRFHFEPFNHSVINYGLNLLGKIFFDPFIECLPSKSCYSGLQILKSDNSNSGTKYRSSGPSTLNIMNSGGQVPSDLVKLSDVVGSLWIKGMDLNMNSATIDFNLYKLFKRRYELLTTPDSEQESSSDSHYNKYLNVTLNLETDSGHQLSLNVTTSLEWPRVICTSKNTLRFPITRYGDKSIREILIENPSSHPLLVQAVLKPDYVTSEVMMQTLTHMKSWTANDEKLMMKINGKDARNFRLLFGSASSDADEVKYLFDVNPTSGTQVLLMPPGVRRKVTIEFEPIFDSERNSSSDQISVKYSTFLIMRNNLTIIDAMKIEGEAGFGLVKIGNQVPDLKSILTFDLQEKHLSKSCKKKSGLGSSSSSSASSSKTSSSGVEPQFTVYKHFNLVNYGKIPVRIKGYFIGPHVGVSSSSYNSKSTIASLNDEPIGSNQLLSELIGKSRCQGFGFKVLNCENLWSPDEELLYHYDPSDDENSTAADSQKIKQNKNPDYEPLIIRPNESKKIHIAFTPDFTMAKTMATLTIFTDDSPSLDHFEKSWPVVLEEYFLGSSGVTSSWIMDLYHQHVNSSYVRSEGKSSRIKDSVDKRYHQVLIYSLIATVPKQMLSNCDRSLPRPYQEMILYYTLAVFMSCLILVTVTLAFFDGARILNYTFYPAVMMTRGSGGLSHHHNQHNQSVGYPETFQAFSFKNLHNNHNQPNNLYNNCQNNMSSGDGTLYTRKKELTVENKIHQASGRKGSGSSRNNIPRGSSSLVSSSPASQNWASYLKQKFVGSAPVNIDNNRRGSTGSVASSLSGDGSASMGSVNGSKTSSSNNSQTNVLMGATDTKGGKSGKNNNKKQQLKNDKGGIKGASGQSQQKSSARSWFESLSQRASSSLYSSDRSKKNQSPPPPLPSFENEFDDEDLHHLTGGKIKSSKVKSKQQQQVSSTVTVSSPDSLMGSKEAGFNKKDVLTSSSSSSSAKTDSTSANNAVSCGSSDASSVKTRTSSSPFDPLELPYNPITGSSISSSSYKQHPLDSSKIQSKSSKMTPGVFHVESGGADTFLSTGVGLNQYQQQQQTSCSSVSASGISPFDSEEFGHWSNDIMMGKARSASAASTSSKTINSSGLIWDNPITMFDSQQAMNELINQNRVGSSVETLSKLSSQMRSLPTGTAAPGFSRNHQRTGSKSSLCPFTTSGPSKTTTTSPSVVGSTGCYSPTPTPLMNDKMMTLSSSNASYPSSLLGNQTSSQMLTGNLSGKLQQQQQPSPLVSNRGIIGQQVSRTTPSPKNLWAPDAVSHPPGLFDHELSYLRDGSTQWNSGPMTGTIGSAPVRAPTPVQRPCLLPTPPEASSPPLVTQGSKLRDWTLGLTSTVDAVTSRLWDQQGPSHSVSPANLWPIGTSGSGAPSPLLTTTPSAKSPSSSSRSSDGGADSSASGSRWESLSRPSSVTPGVGLPPLNILDRVNMDQGHQASWSPLTSSNQSTGGSGVGFSLFGRSPWSPLGPIGSPASAASTQEQLGSEPPGLLSWPFGSSSGNEEKKDQSTL